MNNLNTVKVHLQEAARKKTPYNSMKILAKSSQTTSPTINFLQAPSSNVTTLPTPTPASNILHSTSQVRTSPTVQLIQYPATGLYNLVKNNQPLPFNQIRNNVNNLSTPFTTSVTAPQVPTRIQPAQPLSEIKASVQFFLSQEIPQFPNQDMECNHQAWRHYVKNNKLVKNTKPERETRKLEPPVKIETDCGQNNEPALFDHTNLYSSPEEASNATSVPHEEPQQQVPESLRQFNNFSGKSISNSYRDPNQNPTTTLSANIISNNVPQPPRPDSNIPLNLSDTGRKRKSPENPLVDAHSVKEVWLNSQKKTGNISHLKDIASSIEAKLRSSENPFHPENPEGSIIKDLLLKTRASIVQGQVLVAATSRESDQKERELLASGGKLNAIESHRNLIDSNVPLNPQISIPNKSQDQPQNVMGIPIPKNFLPQPKPTNSVETSPYQCNLCMVTFKSLESIEIHQNHYCKNSKLITTETGIMRPNSTVAHHPPRASPADRRKSESTGSLGEPPIKRSRSDSLPVISAPLDRGCDTIYSRQQSSSATTVTNMSHIGLLQIARPGQSTLSRFVHSSKANMKDSSLGIPNIYKTEMSSSSILTEVPTTGFSLPGIPTPNLSGVLTGIKTQPLFSLPGARSDLNPNKSNGLQDGMMKPVYTMSASQEDKPVTFVLGIPDPHSQPSVVVNQALQQMKSQVPSSLPTRSSLMSNLKIETSVSFSTVVAGAKGHNFLKPPISLNLQSPVKDRFPGQRQIFHSPQRKYDFPSTSKLESPQRPLDIPPMKSPPSNSPISTLNKENKPDRPSTLPLAPGALFKKKDVTFSGATLVSPETPRPKKAYVLHYQNGTAYTFLGLKSSTRVFFCSIHKAQPNYVELDKNSRVSMYSNWKVVAKDSHPSGLSPKIGMSCYNSTYHSTLHGLYTTAAPKKSLMITTHSSRWHEKKDSCHSTLSTYNIDGKRAHGSSEEADSARPVRTVEGGYKSADDNYTYIRGRGRGKHICDSCGIRCKKPSMLKKHIRTHTNVRPLTCKYCNFSFKTKGNLTKHMKSKAHGKKCVELGIIPVPTSADDINVMISCVWLSFLLF